VMKLGRRGFFGLVAGAAVAGPSMAKKAVAEIAAADAMGLAGMAPLPGYYGGGEVSGMSLASDTNWNVARLAQLAMRTAEQHDHYRQRSSVHHLDGDLVANRSFSLATKVRIQRGRNYERDLDQERGHLHAAIAGWFG
jgi:hypothetical protein